MLASFHFSVVQYVSNDITLSSFAFPNMFLSLVMTMPLIAFIDSLHLRSHILCSRPIASSLLGSKIFHVIFKPSKKVSIFIIKIIVIICVIFIKQFFRLLQRCHVNLIFLQLFVLLNHFPINCQF